MNITSVIEAAFSDRKLANDCAQVGLLPKQERDTLDAFINEAMHELTGAFLARNHDVLYWLCPQSFCFYLPRVLCASVKEDNPNLLTNYLLVGWLDRTPNAKLWDDFFSERWLLLSAEECQAVRAWLLWLLEHTKCGIDELSLERAVDTINLLIKRAS